MGGRTPFVRREWREDLERGCMGRCKGIAGEREMQFGIYSKGELNETRNSFYNQLVLFQKLVGHSM